MKCCFCKKEAGKYGHNANPVKDDRCCHECNWSVVVPIRMLRVQKNYTQKIRETIRKGKPEDMTLSDWKEYKLWAKVKLKELKP